MQLIYQNNSQKQLVSWWNLQTYGGADPQTYINGMETYMKSNSIGVTNANEMMLAGVAVYSTSAPADVQQQLAAYQSMGLKGGWIWNFANILSTPSTPTEFATAIEQGLQSSSAATA